VKQVTLRKVQDYKADDPTELGRRLIQLENSVSEMGALIAKLAMGQLTPRARLSSVDIAMGPGQLQAFDTRQGARNVTLVKPSASDAGTFCAVLDAGGGTANITLIPAPGCSLRAASATVAQYVTLLFCDGVDYWRVT